ncbi:MAG TPA: SPOR domain-containing protein [Holophagaceae bacterium]|nr:SPOR domain-containing protein [Holophagaceae bacterium]
MSNRDKLTLDPRSVTWVAMMAAGLLALAFVLGVQVGKQGAALKGPKAKSLDEELKELPESLTDQLKALEAADADTRIEPPKAEAKVEPKPEAKPEPEKWTLQLVATKDAAEAKRVAEKAKAAGFPTTTVKEGGLYKVRLAKPAEKADLDKPAAKLKKAGLKTSPVKAE